MRSPSISLLAAAALLAAASPCAAHHTPAATAATGGSRLSAQRARTNTQLSLAHAESLQQNGDDRARLSVLTLGGEYALTPALSVGASLPLQQIRGRAQDPVVGLGASTAFGKWVPQLASGDAPWVFVTELGLPTQSTVVGLDPGPVGLLALAVGYAARSGNWFVQPFLGFVADARRAGTATDALATVHLAYAAHPRWSLTLGIAAQLRLLSVCAEPQGWETCRLGRASEPRAPTGSPLASVETGVEAALWSNGGLRLAGQLPVTSRRNAQWQVQLAAIVGF